MRTETIDHNTLSKLVEAGAIRGAHVVGQEGGWSVFVKYGMYEKPLSADRKHDVRLFKRFETLVSYLRRIGIVKFDVDAVNFDAEKVERTKRPDRSEALKKAHEAAAYDKWFKEQVQIALDDQTPCVPSEEVEAQFDAFCAELLRREQ